MSHSYKSTISQKNQTKVSQLQTKQSNLHLTGTTITSNKEPSKKGNNGSQIVKNNKNQPNQQKQVGTNVSNSKGLLEKGNKKKTFEKIEVEQAQEKDISQSQGKIQLPRIPQNQNKNKQTQPIEIEKRHSYEEDTQFQKQDQQMMVLDKQKEQEIQYYVYGDLMNFLGVLTDVLETIKFFEGSKDAAYVPVAINRLVLQSNLSSGIHVDCEFNFQSDAEKNLYNKEKQNAQNILNQFLESAQIPQNQKINECLERYEQTLHKRAELRMIDPVKVETQGQFNQQALEKVINGTRQVDFTMQEIQNGKYKKPEKEDILKHTKERSERAQFKLAQVYPEMVKENKQQTKATSKIQKK